MSKTVDQRVVEMRFDNNQFEKGIAQSIGSLNNLKASLNFGDSIPKSDINSLTSNLNGIGTSVDTIASKFNAFGAVAAGVLMNIAGQAVDLGKTMVGNLLNNVTAGYKRYEEMMTSVQTIMYATRQDWADQGEQMDYVTSCIDRLNWYTDETSYNLNDMTSSIGKFVSAGVPLDDAVIDMMGIASWAAISGQNAEKASYAMYNLSQAMAMGKLTNLDWKSIENANMATREFKQTAIDTAIALGTLWEGADGLIYGFDQYGHEIEVNVDNFRTTLAGGWLDRDVLAKTLKVYGDFASELGLYTEDLGLSATEMLKYVDQAVEAGLSSMDPEDARKWLDNLITKDHIKNADLFREALTKLSAEEYELGRAAFKAGQESKTLQDSLDYTADAVHTLWMNIFQDIFGNYLESKELWTGFSELLYEQIVEPLEEVEAIFSSWNSFGGAENLKDAFWNIYESFANVQRAIKEGFSEIFEDFTGLDLAKLTNKFERFTESIKVEKVGYAFKNIKDTAEALAGVLDNLKKNLKTIADAAKKAWDRIFPEDESKTKLRAVDSLTAAIRRWAEGLKELSDKFVLTDEQASKLERTFAGIFAILDILRMLFVAILEPFSNLNVETKNYTDNVLDVTASIGDWLVALRDWIAENEIFQKAVSWVIWFFQQIPIWADQATMALFGMHLDEVFAKIGEAAGAAFGIIVGLFTDFPGTIAMIDEALTKSEFGKYWEDIKTAVTTIWDTMVLVFNWLGDKGLTTIDAIMNYDWAGWWAEVEENAKKVYDAVDSVYEAIVRFINDLPAKLDELSHKLFGKSWAELLDDIKTKITDVIDKIKELIPKIEEGIHAIKRFFGLEDWNVEGGKHDADSPFTVWLHSLDPLEEFGDSWDEFASSSAGKSLRNIAVILAILAGAYLLVNGIKNINATLKTIKTFRSPAENLGPMGVLNSLVDGVTEIQSKAAKFLNFAAFKMIGDMILEIAAAIAIIAVLKTEDLMQGVVVLGGFMFIIVELYKVVGNTDTKQMQDIGTAFAMMGGTMIEIAVALLLLKDIDFGQLLASSGALVGVMMAMVGAVSILKKEEMIPSVLQSYGMSFVVMSVGIIAIAAAMSMMSDLDPLQMIAAGAAIGIVILALTAAVVVLDKVAAGTGVMLAFGGAIALIGAGAALAALGVKLIVDSIIALSNIGTEGFDTLIYGITSFFEVIPDLATNVAVAIVNFCKVLVDNGDTILATVELMLDVMLTAILGALPKILELGTQLMLGLLQSAIDTLPKLVELIQKLFTAIIGIIWEQTPVIIDTVIMLVRELLRSMMVLTPEITATALALLLDTLTQLAENIAPITAKLIEILIGTITGTFDGLTAALPQLMESVWNFVITMVNSFADGLDDHAAELKAAILHLMESMWEAIKTFFGIHSPSTKFSELAHNMIQGMINGLGEMITKAKEKITELADKVLTAICNFFGVDKPTNVSELGKMGHDIIQNMIDGISNMIGKAKEKITELADKVLTAICDFFGIKKPESANEFLNLGKTIIQKFNAGIYGMIEKAKNMVTDFAKRVLDAVCGFFGVETPGSVGELYDIAKDLINGFIEGIYDKVNDAIYAVGDFCQDVVDKCKNVFDVNSPSKVFMEIGRYVDEGLAVGIDKYAKTAIDATEDMGNDTISSISSVLSNISDYINDEMDADPTIRPVLDLSNITDGAQTINDLLSGDRAMNMAASSNMSMNAALANQANTQLMLAELRDALSGFGENHESVVNNNTFNISGSNPKEIADEINKILQEQMVREDSVWA